MTRHTPLWLAAVALCVPAVQAASHPTLALGRPAPDFSLPGFVVDTHGPTPSIRERTYRLADFAEAQVFVLIFTCNHCPTAQAYEDRLVRLVDDYRDRSVAIVAITGNDPCAVRLDELGYSDLGDSYAETQQRALQRRFNFPYLYDGAHQVTTRAYGPAATPHVFIFDAQRRLRYTGRIDNNEDPRAVTQREARAAIDALLAGREPAVTKTRTFGCSTKWAEKRVAAREALTRWNQESAKLQDIDVAGLRVLRRNDGERLRVINLWATWCPACMAEFPELVTIHRMYRKRPFELVTVSLDRPARRDAALAFLQKQAASCTNYIYSGTDRDALAEALDPDWSGATPYTLVVTPGGQVVYRHTGMIDQGELRRILVDHLGRTYFKLD